MSAGLRVIFQLPAKRGEADTKLLGRHSLAATIALKRRKNVVTLDIAQRPDMFGRNYQGMVITDLVRKVVDVDEVACRQGARALYGVLKLSDVARPRMGEKAFERCSRVSANGLSHATGDRDKERFGQPSKVVWPFSQWWDMELNDTEAVVQIASKSPVGDLGLEVTIGCGDYAHVNAPRLVVANSSDLTFLQDSQ